MKSTRAKRTLSLLLVFSMLVSLVGGLPVAAAETAVPVEDTGLTLRFFPVERAWNPLTEDGLVWLDKADSAVTVLECTLALTSLNRESYILGSDGVLSLADGAEPDGAPVEVTAVVRWLIDPPQENPAPEQEAGTAEGTAPMVEDGSVLEPSTAAIEAAEELAPAVRESTVVLSIPVAVPEDKDLTEAETPESLAEAPGKPIAADLRSDGSTRFGYTGGGLAYDFTFCLYQKSQPEDILLKQRLENFTPTNENFVDGVNFFDEIREAGEGNYYYTVQAARDGVIGPVSDPSTQVTVAKLAVPEVKGWTGAAITWKAVENAQTYSVQLYLDGDIAGTPVNVNAPATQAVLSVSGKGSYTATVTALADTGTFYLNSDPSAQSVPYTEGLRLAFDQAALNQGETQRVIVEVPTGVGLDGVAFESGDEGKVVVDQYGQVSVSPGYTPGTEGETVTITAQVAYYADTVYANSFETTGGFVNNGDRVKYATASLEPGGQVARSGRTGGTIFEKNGNGANTPVSPTTGSLIFWYFDPYSQAERASDNTKAVKFGLCLNAFGAGDPAGTNFAGVAYNDPDAEKVTNPAQKEFYTYRTGGTNWNPTSAERSTGWHKFEFRVTSGGMTLYIDGEKARDTDPSITQIKGLMYGNNWGTQVGSGMFVLDRHFIDDIYVVKEDAVRSTATLTYELTILPKAYTVSPEEAKFDLANPADLALTVAPDLDGLTDVVLGGNTLVLDADYTVSGNVLTLKVAALQKNAMGDCALELHMGGQTLRHTVKIIDNVATSYYVNSKTGDDSNSGTSEDAPWQSLTMLNAITFQPGDHIYLHEDSVFNGQQLILRGDGTASKPIILTKYGDSGERDRRPIINGNGTVGDKVYYIIPSSEGTDNRKPNAAVELHNSSFWEISSLEVTNLGATAGKARGGIMVMNNYAESEAGRTTENWWASKAEHIYITDCYVHDVNGMHQAQGGIKHAGGIIGYGYLSDFKVEGCTVSRVDNEGIRNTIFHPGGTNSPSGYPVTAETKVTFKNNYIEKCAGDAMVMAGANLSEMSYNVATDCGRSYVSKTDGTAQPTTNETPVYLGTQNYAAMWVMGCKNSVAQYNEVFENPYKCPDGEPWDIDLYCDNFVYQYNYSYHNAGGAALFMNQSANSIFRYNISVEDGSKNNRDHLFYYAVSGEKRAIAYPQIYNNVFVLSDKISSIFDGNNDASRYVYFQNNIVYANNDNTPRLIFKAGDKFEGGDFTNNIFWPASLYGENITGYFSDGVNVKDNIVADPMLLDGSAIPEGIISGITTADVAFNAEKLAPFQVEADSPAVNMGVTVPYWAGVEEKLRFPLAQDIFGNPIGERNTIDIGAFEYPEDELPPAGVTGVKLTETASIMAGKTFTLAPEVIPRRATNRAVTWLSSDPTIAAVDENGVITALKMGTVEIKVTTADGGFTAICKFTVQPTPDEDPRFQALREKWRAYLLGGDGTDLDMTNEAVQIYVRDLNQNANGYWETLIKSTVAGRDDLWADLDMTPIKDYSDAAYVRSGNVGTTLRRLNTITSAYATKGCDLYQNEAVKAELVAALDYLTNTYFKYGEKGWGNWYHWEITSPTALMNIVMVLYHELDAGLVDQCVKAAQWYVPYCNEGGPNSNGPAMTGGNLLLKANAAAQIGVLGNQEAILQNVKDGVKTVLSYNDFSQLFAKDADGFYADGSYIQHQALPYIGGYGTDLYNNLGVFLLLLSGSDWELRYEDGAERVAYDFVFSGVEPFLYEGRTMDMVSSRDVTRKSSTDHGRTARLLGALMPLRGTFPTQEQNDRFDSMMKYYLAQDPEFYYGRMSSVTSIMMASALVADVTVSPRSGYELTKVFAMDKAVHITPSYGLAISMHSTRTYGHELINNEGKRTWNTSDGMFYLYDADTEQYADGYWATVDPTRLPGITAEHTVFQNGDGDRTRNVYDWTGGAVLGDAGTIASHFRTLGIPGSDARSGADVKKSYFFFGDRVVAVGSDIASSTGNTIETVVDNRRISGDNTVTADGVVLALTGEPTALEANWLHLEGNVSGSDVGYWFPQTTNLNAMKDTRTQNWSAQGDTTGEATNTYATFWVDHGVKPTGAGYAYVLLPGKTAGDTAAYAASPDIEILRQDSAVHAVRDSRDGVTGLNFWENKPATAAGVGVDRAASVVLRQDGDDLSIAVADPTQRDKTITVSLAMTGELISKNDNITVVQTEPFIQFTVNTNKLGGASSTITLKARALEGTQVVSCQSDFSAVNAQKDTAFEALRLPETAVFSASDLKEYTLPLVWEKGNYDGGTRGDYTLVGRPDCSGVDGLSNVSGIAAQIVVRVDARESLAVEDTWLRGGTYGGDPSGANANSTALTIKLDTDISYVRKALVKLDLTALPEAWTAAYLKIQTTEPDTGVTGGAVYAVGSTWDDETVTFDSIPPRSASAPAATFTAGQAKAGPMTLDVTEAVKAALAKGDTQISFTVEATGTAGSKNQFNLYSLESSGFQKPTLAWTTPADGNPLERGLVLYTSFDAETVKDGKTLDLSGEGHDGTVVGSVQFVPGVSGNAMKLVGQKNAGNDNAAGDRYITYGKSADIIPATGNFSISLWYQSAGASSNATLFSNKDFKSGANTGFAMGCFTSDLRMNLTGNGQTRKDVQNAGGGPLFEAKDGGWHHLTVTVDRSGSMTYYVDGLVAGNADISATKNSIEAGLDLVLGAGGSYKNAVDNTLMDELRVYDRALSVSEVGKLYQMDKPVYTFDPDADLLLYAPFDGDAKDLSGKNYNGTVTGEGVTFVESPLGGQAVKIVNRAAANGSGNTGSADSYVDFGTAITKDGLGAKSFTLSFWYQPDPKMNSWGTIISNKNYTSGGNKGFALGYYDTDSKMNFVPSSGTKAEIAKIDLTPAGWHQFTVTVNAGKAMTVYMDGEKVGSTALTAGTVHAELPLILGADGQTKWPITNIQVDELRIYAKALPAEGVEALYELGAEHAAVGNAGVKLGEMAQALTAMEPSVIFPATRIDEMKKTVSDALASLTSMDGAQAKALLERTQAAYQTFLAGARPLASVNVISDVHIGGADLTAANAVNYAAALENMKTLNPGTTIAVINAGDLTNNSSEAEYKGFYDVTAAHLPLEAGRMLTIMGNHDVRGASGTDSVNWNKDPRQPEKCVNWPDTKARYQKYNAPYMPEGAADTLYFSVELDGYTFIMLNTELGLKDAMYMSDAQIAWFEQTMKAAYEKDPMKPIFVVAHQALNDTHWRSNVLDGFDGIKTDGSGQEYQTGADSRVKEIMAKYPTGIFFSGHIHNGFGVAETVVREFGATVDVPSFSDTENGVKDRGVGYVVQVYDSAVAIRAYNFVTGQWLPEYDVILGLPGLPANYQQAKTLLSGDTAKYDGDDVVALRDLAILAQPLMNKLYDQSGLAWNTITPPPVAFYGKDAHKEISAMGVRLRTLLDKMSGADLDIASVEVFEDRSVKNGTALAALDLPQTVNVILKGGESRSLTVSWTCDPAYDESVGGTYIFTGALTLDGGVTNTGGKTARLVVTVEQNPSYAYTVTFVSNGGTEARPNTITVTYPATSVGTLPAAPSRSGYSFIGWNTAANGSGTNFTAATSVTADLTVYAQWTPVSQGGSGSGDSSGGGSSGGSTDREDRPKPAPDVGIPDAETPLEVAPNITVKSGQGGTVDSKTNEDGSVTITLKPDPGKQLLSVRVDGLSVPASETLTVPKGGTASVVAVFGDPSIDAAGRFSDLEGLPDYARRGIRYAVSSGLFNGVDIDHFAPHDSMDRAMFATVLARLYGAKTELYSETGFTDVAMDEWYGASVAWAADQSLVSGVGDGRYDPKGILTRQALVTLVYRFAKMVGADTSATGELTGYSDAGSLDGWAREAMTWAVEIGLVNGRGDTLAPKDPITRAEAAIILERMSTLLEKKT